MDRNRFFGGHPVAVLVRLALLSIIAGIILSALDVTPVDLFDRLNLLARRLYDVGFDAFEWLLKYFLLGAVVVFPIWLVVRLVRAFGRRSDDRGD
ncbi:MAG TPA: DUF6460 domain-containing protein [Hyphomicrobiaceae bacterium]|nr:DUF6460 domain-containing protein [Hyphomicrobiaceae bacterium]